MDGWILLGLAAVAMPDAAPGGVDPASFQVLGSKFGRSFACDAEGPIGNAERLAGFGNVPRFDPDLVINRCRTALEREAELPRWLR